MNDEELIINEYKIYSQMKDNFIDRNFSTNKFYLVLIIVLLITMYLLKDYSFVYGLTSTLVFSFVGLMICMLWWINVDSYNFLIKIKLSEVIEKIEEKLPVQPHKMEIEAINLTRISKRKFLFADVQKVIATIIFILFLILFFYEIIVAIISCNY